MIEKNGLLFKMNHTLFSEKEDYPFEIQIKPEWVLVYRLDIHVFKWLDETINDGYICIYHAGCITHIAFKEKEDLLLFKMVWD